MKYEVVTTPAWQFPELLPMLPKPRKPWMSEDERMASFDAIALGLMHCASSGLARRARFLWQPLTPHSPVGN